MWNNLQFFLESYVFFLTTLPVVLVIGGMLYYNFRLKKRYDRTTAQLNDLLKQAGLAESARSPLATTDLVVSPEHLKQLEHNLQLLEQQAELEPQPQIANVNMPRAKKLAAFEGRLDTLLECAREGKLA